MTHRECPTVAPPPPQVSARAIREQVAKLRASAAAILANSNDLEAAAAALESK